MEQILIGDDPDEATCGVDDGEPPDPALPHHLERVADRCLRRDDDGRLRHVPDQHSPTLLLE